MRSVWCVVVCTSRLYLGMHSVADLVVGLILAFILFIPLVTFGKLTTNCSQLRNGYVFEI
jgi:membrane-associated phospholipid phosphatase